MSTSKIKDFFATSCSFFFKFKNHPAGSAIRGKHVSCTFVPSRLLDFKKTENKKPNESARIKPNKPV